MEDLPSMSMKNLQFKSWNWGFLKLAKLNYQWNQHVLPYVVKQSANTEVHDCVMVHILFPILHIVLVSNVQLNLTYYAIGIGIKILIYNGLLLIINDA